MDLKLISVDPETEFELIEHYIGLLFKELFGEAAVPTKEQFASIQTQLADASAFHWAYKVVDGEKVVAFFTLGQSCSVFAKGRYGIINELWVSPESRGRGVGKQLLDAIKQLAGKKGWLRLDVSAPPTEQWQSTFEFYRKNGFELTGKKLKYLL